jgi:ketosteroid isomerase-like protein
MAYGVVHHFPDGTKEQYAASIAAVHPGAGQLPAGQIFHAAGPSAGGWTIIAVHDSQESWERFRDEILMPTMQRGIAGGFAAPPQETGIAIETLMPSMGAEDAVRQASARFYAALNSMANGDASPMSAVWTHREDVTTMHPIGQREVGWEQVGPVWEQVAAMCTEGQVQLHDQLIRVGTDLAYEVGVEEGEITIAGERVAFNERVTNIYRREDGEWKIVHHHSDVSPAMTDLLSRLQPPA